MHAFGFRGRRAGHPEIPQPPGARAVVGCRVHPGDESHVGRGSKKTKILTSFYPVGALERNGISAGYRIQQNKSDEYEGQLGRCPRDSHSEKLSCVATQVAYL